VHPTCACPSRSKHYAFYDLGECVRCVTVRAVCEQGLRGTPWPSGVCVACLQSASMTLTVSGYDVVLTGAQRTGTAWTGITSTPLLMSKTQWTRTCLRSSRVWVSSTVTLRVMWNVCSRTHMYPTNDCSCANSIPGCYASQRYAGCVLPLLMQSEVVPAASCARTWAVLLHSVTGCWRSPTAAAVVM